MGLRTTFDRWFGRPSQAPPSPAALPAPPSSPTSTPTDPDRPIEAESADRFARAPFAKVIARYVANTPKGQSVVFALVGPWGAGKTSVLNLVGHALEAEDVAVLRFNPWLFSGTEQIATQLLRELSVQLGARGVDLKEIGEKIEAYGGLIAAVPFIGGVGTAAGKITAAHRGSVNDARTRVETLLREKGRRVVVFVDDIDRLEGDEVRQVFKLVRLVADFPNVSYVLAFDRVRVEKALKADDVSGREFLAKIVQSSFELPSLDPDVLRKHLLGELETCVEGRVHGKFHSDGWADILLGVVVPLIKTPRDVRRYVNAIGPAADMLGEEVALEDLLGLEAVRLFAPDVFDAIGSVAELLTMGSSAESAMRRHRLGPEDKKRVQDFIALSRGHERVAHELCAHLFPASRFALDNTTYSGEFARGWRRERKVAHREVLDTYFRRTVAVGGLAARRIEDLVEAFGDEAATRNVLNDLDDVQLESALLRLEDHVERLAGVAFENGLVAVLEAGGRLRRDRNSIFDFGGDLAVGRLVYWILRNVPDVARRTVAMASVLSRTQSLTWRTFVLSSLAGHEGEVLMEPTVRGQCEVALKTAILTASADDLRGERDLVRVFRWAAFDPTTKAYDSAVAARLADSGVMRSLLSSALSQEMRGSFGSRAVKVTWRMPWEDLRNLVGDEHTLGTYVRAAVVDWHPTEDDRAAEALRQARDLIDGKTVIPAREGPAPPSDEPAEPPG